jgi:hypothetical protein
VIHRTRLKVVLNPLLKRLGWVIVSIIDDEKGFEGYALRRWKNGAII